MNISSLVKLVETFLERLLYASRLLVLVAISFSVGVLMWYIYHQVSLMWHHVATFIMPSHGGDTINPATLLFESVELVLTVSFVSMLNIGTYNELVSPFDHLKDPPGWLKHLNMNSLKVKLGASIIGLSSTHLMSAFVDPEIATAEWQKKVVIHLVLCVSAVTIYVIVKMWLHKNEEE
jgi:uncharacterized protein (TIGR00645 family)